MTLTQPGCDPACDYAPTLRLVVHTEKCPNHPGAKKPPAVERVLVSEVVDSITLPPATSRAALTTEGTAAVAQLLAKAPRSGELVLTLYAWKEQDA